MNVGTSAPPTGMTPKGRPIAVPRSHAGSASPTSLRDRNGRPDELIVLSLAWRRIRDAMKNTSPSARMPTVTVTRETPSKSSGTPKVKRSVPETESMPMTENPMPSTRAMSPLSTESATTEDVATKAKSARAKNSAGPKLVDRSASAGATKTTRKQEMNPPMNAPIAAVARACGARPSLAILWPSKVEAIAEACPGVFMRMAIVESPKSPPK